MKTDLEHYTVAELDDGDWTQPSLVDAGDFNQYDRRVWATADGTGDRGRGRIHCRLCDLPLADHELSTHADRMGRHL